MNYRIEISSIAEAEADKAFLRLSQISSPIKSKSMVFRVARSDRLFVSNV